jgi:hypothetical protein
MVDVACTLNFSWLLLVAVRRSVIAGMLTAQTFIGYSYTWITAPLHRIKDTAKINLLPEMSKCDILSM